MTTILSFGKIATASACAAAIALASGFKDSGASNLAAYQAKVAEFDSVQSPFQVQAVTLGDNIGTATIKNNGFSIEVGFEYTVVGKNIDISSLQINSITTPNGKPYGDWTINEDHQQMIAQIRSYVGQYGFVGA